MPQTTGSQWSRCFCEDPGHLFAFWTDLPCFVSQKVLPIRPVISVCKWNLLKEKHKASESCMMTFMSPVICRHAVIHTAEINDLPKKKKKKIHSTSRTS